MTNKDYYDCNKLTAEGCHYVRSVATVLIVRVNPECWQHHNLLAILIGHVETVGLVLFIWLN